MKNLSLYKINKRINSTLLPTAEQLISTMGVALKSATSIDTPTFVIAVGAEDLEAIWKSNYAKYENSYYWINDITQINNNHVELSCKKDSLATYRDYIYNSKLNVLYSSSAGRTDIVDSRLEMKTTEILGDLTLAEVHKENPFKNSEFDYILEVVNDLGGTFDTPYVINATSMNTLTAFLCSDGYLTEVSKYFSNPLQNIIKGQITALNTSYIQLPFEEHIKIGNNDTKITGTRFQITTHRKFTYSGILPWAYNDFRKRSPYSHMMLYLPFVGIVDIDVNQFYHSSDIIIELDVEYITGNLIYTIYATKPGETEVSVAVSRYNGNCNSEIPIAQINNNPLSKVGGALTSIAGIAASNPFIASAGAATSIQGFVNITQVNGAISSLLGAQLPLSPRVYIWSNNSCDTPDNYRAVKGLPLNSAVELSTLSGYVQCVNASVAAPAMESEIQEINNFLNGGVYLE